MQATETNVTVAETLNNHKLPVEHSPLVSCSLIFLTLQHVSKQTSLTLSVALREEYMLQVFEKQTAQVNI
jgi:hypothetical protein